MEKEKEDLLNRLTADKINTSHLSETLTEMEKERDNLDDENVELKDRLKKMGSDLIHQGISSAATLTDKGTAQSLAEVLKEKVELANQLIGMEEERDNLDNENTTLQHELRKARRENQELKEKIRSRPDLT